jgi:hypothetical protein
VTEQYPESGAPDSPESSGETPPPGPTTPETIAAEATTTEAGTDGAASTDEAVEAPSETATEDTGGRHLEVAHASGLEDPSALAEGLGDAATGDVVIDRVLEDLQQAPPDDLDAQIEAGQRVHDTLKSRLSDLGGE